MSNSVTLAGATILNLKGNLIKVGDKLENLLFTGVDLSEVNIDDLAGPLLLNFFPSLDTDICANSIRSFNKEVAEKFTVLNISGDLPFAYSRFCSTQGIENSKSLSSFRHQESLEKLGLLLDTLPLKGLAARAVVIVDADHVVKYVSLNQEIKTDPDFAAAKAVVAEIVAS